MATADQIRSLVKAYNAHDDEKFKTVVLQIAAHEAIVSREQLYDYCKKARALMQGKETPDWLSFAGNCASIHEIVDSVSTEALALGAKMAE